MKLKTLKDIDLCKYFDYCVHPDRKCKEECFTEEIKKDLRQEAIKWGKELRNKNHAILHHAKYGIFYDKFDDREEDIQDRTKGLVEWIKFFFNITEGELK